MLMDEPFGAVDPITRAHLQNELLKILAAVGKTVLFVTHDVDEAIRMGDRIAILRDGRLVQHGSPAEILVRPADPFVEAFVGADRALKRLGLVAIQDVMRRDGGAAAKDAPAIPLHATALDALPALLTARDAAVSVVDATGGAVGSVSFADLQRVLAAGSAAI